METNYFTDTGGHEHKRLFLPIRDYYKFISFYNTRAVCRMVLLKMVEGVEAVPDPADQKQLITERIRQPMAIGQNWYLIDSKWYKTFKQYVGIEDVDRIAGDHPGPIDNSPLFSEEDSNELRGDLLDHLDYVLIPEEAWKLLAAWYGVVADRTVIKRQVVEYGIFVKYCKVEIYPVNLRLCKDFNYDNEFKYKFSIADSVGKIENVMRSLFKISSNVDTRLWSCFSINTFDLLTKKERTIQDEGIFQNQLVIIETRKEDGSWYRQRNKITPSVLSTASTASDNKGAIGKSVYAKHDSKPSSSSSSGPVSSLVKHENRTNQPTAKPGLCGLSNLGNTCFMNSVIQCMSNCPPITNYFLRDEHLKELNVKNPLGMRGEIAKAFSNLIKLMWSGKHTYTVPHQFKLQVGRFAPQFCGYQQHDSQELLTFLLDGLHEDLNRIKDKPYVETKHERGRTDEEMAAEAWQNYKKRNDSIIVDFFHGLLKSTVICPDCDTISITFDPFCYLSLPLPLIQNRRIQILLFPLKEEQKPLKYTLELPKNGRVQHLIDRLGAVRGQTPSSFIVTEVIKHHFHKIFTNEEHLESIEDRDNIYVYEVPLNYETQLVIPVYLWESNNKNLYANHLFGYPLLIPVEQDQCTYNMLYCLIWKKICQYHCISNGDSVEVLSSYITEAKCSAKEDRLFSEEDDCESNSSATESVFSLYLIHKNAVRADVIKIHNDNKPIHFPDLIGNSYIAAKWHPKDVKKFTFDVDVAETTSKAKQFDYKALHLTDCLKLYTATEKLSANDTWYCPLCKKLQLATKKFDLWRLPKILIIHLKRFSYNALHREKIDTMVHFPLKQLNMSEFIIDKNHPETSYNLIGVCNHYGGMGGGHYTAFCQNKIDKCWHLFDDIKISSATEDDVISRNAYVLFYMQLDERMSYT